MWWITFKISHYKFDRLRKLISGFVKYVIQNSLLQRYGILHVGCKVKWSCVMYSRFYLVLWVYFRSPQSLLIIMISHKVWLMNN